jgi:FtsZ-interacting cell division protein YlmF
MRQHSDEVFHPAGGSPHVPPRPSGADSSPQMLVFAADRFEDAEAVIAAVRGGRTVVLNVAALPKAVGQRLVDYVCGGLTAMDGQVHHLGEEGFLLAPPLAHVEVDSPGADFPSPDAR